MNFGTPERAKLLERATHQTLHAASQQIAAGNPLMMQLKSGTGTATHPSATDSHGPAPSVSNGPLGPLPYFGRVVVINGEQYTDRMQRMERRLQALGIPFERFAGLSKRESGGDVHPHLTETYYPLARSHRTVIERSLAAGDERVLILEDDAVFRDDAVALLERMAVQLQGLEWDVFSLGIHLYKDGGVVSENISRALKGFHSHAYVVNRPAMPRVIEMIGKAMREGWHYDSFSSHNLIRLYSRPIVAVQEPGISGILGGAIDRLDQYFPPFDRADFFANCQEARGWANEPAEKEPVKYPSVVAEGLRRAKELQRSGRFPEADQVYQQVLLRDPENAEALHYLGLLYFQQGNEAALDLLHRSVDQNPNSPEFLCNLGMVLGQANRGSEALQALDRALAIKPDYAEAHTNRGLALDRMGLDEEAMSAWRTAIQFRPDLGEPHNHLGRKLAAKGEHAESLMHLRESIRLNPRHSDAHNNLGITLRKSGDVAAAAAAFRRATDIAPNFAEAHANLGTAYNEQGKPQLAIPWLRKAIELKPDFTDAHWNLSMSLLACGEMEQGWLEYEWRRHLPSDQFMKRDFAQPQWNGAAITGCTVLVLCEQGLGDTLQFVRYIGLLAKRGARVILECQPSLREILRQVPGVFKIVTRDDPRPRFDTYVRLLSLPGIFNTRLGNIPAEVPYLQADGSRVAKWKQQMTGGDFKIGIAWQGNTAFPNDKCRSVPLARFETLAGVPGVRLYSLQKHVGIEQMDEARKRFDVTTFDQPLDADGAFLDTAAIMMNLDLVVTSDTAIAHLAGALALQTWVTLSTNCDWRWLREGKQCQWYPTMTLYRQDAPQDWAGVFDRIAQDLRMRMVGLGGPSTLTT